MTRTAAAESFREDRHLNQERRMALRIPPEFERAILERVQSGMYGSTDEALQACLDALEREEAEIEEVRAELKPAREALRRGEWIPGEEAFARLKEERNGIIPADLKQFVEEQVRQGRFRSASEVVEAALHRLQHEMTDTDDDLEALRHEIDLGIASAEEEELIPGEVVAAHIRAKFRGVDR